MSIYIHEKDVESGIENVDSLVYAYTIGNINIVTNTNVPHDILFRGFATVMFGLDISNIMALPLHNGV